MRRGLRAPVYRALLAGGEGVVAYLPQAQAAFDAMDVQPSDALKALYNTAIGDLIDAGIWDILDALYFLNVHAAQAARLNLVNLGTNDLIAFNSPVFTQYVGYAGNGTSSYLDEEFVASTAGGNFTQNSASVFAWCLKEGTSANPIIEISGINTTIWPRYTDDMSYLNVNDGAFVSPASADGRGLWLGSRTTANLITGYKNGSSIGTDTNASEALQSGESYIFATNAGGFFSGGAAFAGFGAGLDGTQASDQYDILSAFKTGVEAL